MPQLTGSSSPLEPAGSAATRALVLTERIRGEFREMPGLTLTVAQAQRLWNVDLPTCTDLLSQLVDAGFLCLNANGAYGRVSDLTTRPLRMAKVGTQFLEIDRSRRAAAEG